MKHLNASFRAVDRLWSDPPPWRIARVGFMGSKMGGADERRIRTELEFSHARVSAAQRSFGGGGLPCRRRSPISYPASGWRTSTPNPGTKPPCGRTRRGDYLAPSLQPP